MYPKNNEQTQKTTKIIYALSSQPEDTLTPQVVWDRRKFASPNSSKGFSHVNTATRFVRSPRWCHAVQHCDHSTRGLDSNRTLSFLLLQHSLEEKRIMLRPSSESCCSRVAQQIPEVLKWVDIEAPATLQEGACRRWSKRRTITWHQRA